MKVCKIRLLRHKYNITTAELGRVCGYAPQSVSRLELLNETMTENARRRLLKGFYDIAHRRQASALDLLDDITTHEGSLFDSVEESEYEL